jgi:hypothetical protein
MRQDLELTDVHGAKRLRMMDSTFFFRSLCDEGEHPSRKACKKTHETESRVVVVTVGASK